MRNKKLVSIIVTSLVLASILVADGALGLGISKTASNVLSPIGVVFSTIGENVRGFFGNFGHIGTLQKDNKELNDKLNSALAEIASLSEAKKENDSLKADLGFKQSSGFDLVPAVVAFFDPSLKDGITVRVNNASGIKVGNVVLSEGFLIGRVAEINNNNVKVQLITDSLSSIPTTVQNKTITGIAKGQIGNGLTLEQVPQSEAVTQGDLVITSGLGGDLPKGLVLGRVDEVQKVAGSIFQQVNLRTMVELGKLERVMIAR